MVPMVTVTGAFFRGDAVGAGSSVKSAMRNSRFDRGMKAVL